MQAACSISRKDFVQGYKHVLASDFAQDGTLATLATSDHPLPWSSATAFIPPVPGHDTSSWNSSLAINCDETLLAVSLEQKVYVYDATTLEKVQDLGSYDSSISGLEWHPHIPSLLLIASRDTGTGAQSLPLIRIRNVDASREGADQAIEQSALAAAEHALRVLGELHPSRDVLLEEELTNVTLGFSSTLRKTFSMREVHAGRALVGQLASYQSPGYINQGAQIAFLRHKEHIVVIWDTATRTEVVTLTGHSDRIMWLGPSPNGKLLATSSWDRTVRLWNPLTGDCVQTLTGPTNQLWGGAFSPDGNMIAAGCGDGNARIWNVHTGALLHTCTGPGGWLRSLSFGAAPSGGWVLGGAGGHTGFVCLFDATSGERCALWQVDNQAAGGFAGFTEISRVKFSPDGRRLAFTGPDGRLVMYEPGRNVKWEWYNDGEKKDSARGNVVWGKDSQKIWSLGSDAFVRVWNL